MFDFDWQHERVSWNPGYETGVPVLDREHASLLERINDVDEAITRGDGIGAIMGRIEILRRDSLDHFDHEEALMRQAGYPNAESHARLHSNLIAMISDLLEQARSGDRAALQRGAAEVLKTWLVSHLLGADRAYSDVMSEPFQVGSAA
ncbi:MAG: bacteriohemerythrin [Rhodospirillales bacterium]